MSPSIPSPDSIELAIISVSREVDRGLATEGMWRIYSEEDLWADLVFCILSSRVRFETAKHHTHRLREIGLLDRAQLVDHPNQMRQKLTRALSQTGPHASDRPSVGRYPFAQVRSGWIVRTARDLYATPDRGITLILESARTPAEARDGLANACTGLGYKEASLFLRNVRYSSALAVIDTHVLDFLQLMGFAEGRKSKSLTKRKYLDLEAALVRYAREMDIAPANLDIAIWVVMRELKQTRSVG